MFDLRVPESLASLPGRVHVMRDEDDFIPSPPKQHKRVVYQTDEERREARRRTWNEYAARNREKRVKATQAWREKTGRRD